MIFIRLSVPVRLVEPLLLAQPSGTQSVQLLVRAWQSSCDRSFAHVAAKTGLATGVSTKRTAASPRSTCLIRRERLYSCTFRIVLTVFVIFTESYLRKLLVSSC